MSLSLSTCGNIWGFWYDMGENHIISNTYYIYCHQMARICRRKDISTKSTQNETPRDANSWGFFLFCGWASVRLIATICFRLAICICSSTSNTFYIIFIYFFKMRHIVALKFFWYNLNVAIPYTGIERGVSLWVYLHHSLFLSWQV